MENSLRVLVVYPREFVDSAFLYARLKQFDRAFQEYVVVAPSDPGGYLQDLFPGRLEVASKQLTHRIHRASLVDSCTHVVVFWDGSEDIGDFVYLANLHRKKSWIIAVETTRVVNKDTGDDFDIYIGRRGPWGNPFVIGVDGTREEVIDKYRDYFRREFLQSDEKRAWLLTLKGKRLGCHCKPAACHGDVLAEYLNGLTQRPIEDADAMIAPVFQSRVAAEQVSATNTKSSRET